MPASISTGVCIQIPIDSNHCNESVPSANAYASLGTCTAPEGLSVPRLPPNCNLLDVSSLKFDHLLNIVVRSWTVSWAETAPVLPCSSSTRVPQCNVRGPPTPHVTASHARWHEAP